MMTLKKKSFAFSIFFHIAIIVTFAFSPGLMDWLNLSSMKERKLVESIRVDLVGMPTLTPKELQALKNVKVDTRPEESTTDPADTKKEEETKAVEKEKKEQVVKIAKNKKNKKKKKSKKKLKKALLKSKLKNLKKLVVMGNKISKGHSATGELSTEQLDPFDHYALGVKTRVKQYWELPGYLIEKNLSAKVRLYIDQDGGVNRVELTESSGNEDYDKRVLQAIDLASPFDEPSTEIVKSLQAGNLILLFPF